VQSKIEHPSVAIIVINWNNYFYTSGCLDSLRQIDYPNYKVIVVDNGSHDGSDVQLEAIYPEILLLRNENNKGFTGGNNRGIEWALNNGFEYLMLLNNDTEVEPDFLSELIRGIEGDPTIGAIQPKFYFLSNKELVWNAGGKIIKSLGVVLTVGVNNKSNQNLETSGETAWITGCGFLVRSSIIKKIGGLNERFFMYYEDVDWSLKIKSLGYKLWYCPSSIVYHEAGVSNKSEVGKEGVLNPQVHYFAARNNLLLLRKYTPWYFIPTVTIFQMAKYASYISYFLVRKRFIKIRSICKGLKDGLSTNGL